MRPVRRYAAPVTALVLAAALGLGACSSGDDDADSDTGTSAEATDESATDTDSATDDDSATEDDTADDDAAGDDDAAAGEAADAELVPIEGSFVAEVAVPAGVEYQVGTITANTIQVDFPAPEDPEALTAFYQAWFTEQGMENVAVVSGLVTAIDGTTTWTLVTQGDEDWALVGTSL